MAMQTDVKNKYIGATGAAGIGSTRIKAIQYVATAATGSIVVADGQGGTTRLQIDTPGDSSSAYILIPGEGVKFNNDPYFTVTGVLGVTFFYG